MLRFKKNIFAEKNGEHVSVLLPKLLLVFTNKINLSISFGEKRQFFRRDFGENRRKLRSQHRPQLIPR
jgi:hypothetical protein